MAVIRTVKAGSPNVSVTLQIIDSTAGTPETGVLYNTAGMDLWYRREFEVKTSITEATLAALTTAHADGGFLEIGNGAYRLDLPDDAVDTAGSSTFVEVGGTVTGMIVIGGTVELVLYNPQDTVRLGLTALPNAAADAAGGLAISDAGGLDLDAMNTNVSDIETQVGTAGAGLTAIPTQDANLVQIGGVAQSATDLKDFADAGYDPATNKVQGVVLVDTTTTNTDMVAAAPTAAAVADAVLDEALSGHVAAGSLGKAVADTETDAAAVLDDTGTAGVVIAAAQTVATVTDVTNQVTADATAINGDATAAANLANVWANLDTQINVASATGSTIVFDDAAMSAVDDFYNGMAVFVYGGTGAGQQRRVDDYTGATKTATVSPNWATNPDATSDVIVMVGPGDLAGTAPTAAAVADAVWDEALSGHVVAGSAGKSLADTEADTNELQTDDVPALIAALNDPTSAAVATAVWASTDFADPAAVPAWSADAAALLSWVVQQHRNRIKTTATTATAYQDDATTAVGTSTVSDDTTTFERGEWT